MFEQPYGYREVSGNIFNSRARALVNTVNCVGVMGKGIALEFRRRYPEMFSEYVKACQQNELEPGKVYYSRVYKDLLILNFAIKGHWRFDSEITWIESCLEQFSKEYQQKGIDSIAFPWMGAMNGGLDLSDIKATMRRYLQPLSGIAIEVYDFDNNASDPLFDTLKDVIEVESIQAIARNSCISQRICQRIVELVTVHGVPSLYHLTNSAGIGDTSIDKLYSYLTKERGKRDTQLKKLPSNNLIQFSLL